MSKQRPDWQDQPDGDGYYWICLRDPMADFLLVQVTGGAVWMIGTEEDSPLRAFPGAQWLRLVTPSRPWS